MSTLSVGWMLRSEEGSCSACSEGFPETRGASHAYKYVLSIKMRGVMLRLCPRCVVAMQSLVAGREPPCEADRAWAHEKEGA